MNALTVSKALFHDSLDLSPISGEPLDEKVSVDWISQVRLNVDTGVLMLPLVVLCISKKKGIPYCINVLKLLVIICSFFPCSMLITGKSFEI